MPRRLGPWIGASRRIPIVGHMRVRIDHSRHAGIETKIDDLRSRWNCPACGDALNFVVLYDDDGIGDCAVSVPQLSELHGLGRRRRVWRDSKREGEDESAKTKRGNACGESHRLSFRGSRETATPSTFAKARQRPGSQVD